MCNKKCTVENRDDEFDFFFPLFLFFFIYIFWRDGVLSLQCCFVLNGEGGREERLTF